MLGIVGTVPDPDFPVVEGKVSVNGESVCIGAFSAPVNRGTPALLAASVAAAGVMGLGEVWAFLVGDLGTGSGSRSLYSYLEKNLPSRNLSVLLFHYLQPDVDWHNKVLFAVQEMNPRPVLIADAGFMYAAKMSGQATDYDLFTPDAGELAFLADEQAPHPFYTRGFILHDKTKIPELIARAYEHENAAKYLLVKGKKDYIASRDGILAEVDKPWEEALECIGGTGDTLSGIAAALVESGMAVPKAAYLSARVNRLAGSLARPTPATQVLEIIRAIPGAFKKLGGAHPEMRDGHERSLQIGNEAF
ncbi:MAG TPA: sugar kinase [Desulfobacteraceae bacterium]|jgi:ADP-dependent NAD(P)H-hydrate dehydratase / NAD(P)H-hydrate epimerase|nr:sugar kinase [Desulfobacteraceae bacterium]